MLEPIALWVLGLFVVNLAAGAGVWMAVGRSPSTLRRAIGVIAVIAANWIALKLAFANFESAAPIGMSLGMTYGVTGAVIGAELAHQIIKRLTRSA